MLRDVLRAPVRALGVARSPRAVELLRDVGLYVPLRVLYEGLPAQERRRWADFREFKRNWRPVVREVHMNGPLRHLRP